MKRESGFTLVELVVAIVIIGTCAATLVGVLGSMAKQSADSMVASQANNIAAAYLRDILAKPVVDPDGIDGTEPRNAYDNVNDYSRLPDTYVTDRLGNPVAAFAGYQVIVQIQQIGLNGIPSSQARRVEVTVIAPTGFRTVVSGFKAT